MKLADFHWSLVTFLQIPRFFSFDLNRLMRIQVNYSDNYPALSRIIPHYYYNYSDIYSDGILSKDPIAGLSQ